MDIRQETITPAIAAEYLKLNTHNRPCSNRRVTELSGAMRRGEWIQNGDAIRFSDDGILLDGQGRLKACIASGVSFKTLVIRGLPRDSFRTMDLGKKRNAADILSLDGEKNTTRLARALRFLMMYEYGNFGGQTYTPQQLEECLSRHPGIRYWIAKENAMYKITGHGAIILAICYLGGLTRPIEAIDFFTKLTQGVGLEKGSPVLALRDRLQQDRAATSKMMPQHVTQIAIRAYNAFVKGDTRIKLAVNKDSNEIPRVVM